MKAKVKHIEMNKALLSIILFLGIAMPSAIPSHAQLDKQYEAEQGNNSAECQRRFRQAQYRGEASSGANRYYIGTIKRVWLIENNTGNIITDCRQKVIGIIDEEANTERGRILMKEENGDLIQYSQPGPEERVRRFVLAKKINW